MFDAKTNVLLSIIRKQQEPQNYISLTLTPVKDPTSGINVDICSRLRQNKKISKPFLWAKNISCNCVAGLPLQLEPVVYFIFSVDANTGITLSLSDAALKWTHFIYIQFKTWNVNYNVYFSLTKSYIFHPHWLQYSNFHHSTLINSWQKVTEPLFGDSAWRAHGTSQS